MERDKEKGEERESGGKGRGKEKRGGERNYFKTRAYAVVGAETSEFYGTAL